MSPHAYQYLDIHNRQEIMNEFIRRVEWNYPSMIVHFVELDNGLYFAWVITEWEFEGSHQSSQGNYQRRVIPSEVGM